jgi:methanogenic corrinoid protein MtbC1
MRPPAALADRNTGQGGTMNTAMTTLGSGGLQRFRALQGAAVSAVAERLFPSESTQPDDVALRDEYRQFFAMHLEFLQPVLEFGLLTPMVEYLRWFDNMCAAREIPAEHLARSLDLLADYFNASMEPADSVVVCAALAAARSACQADEQAPLVPDPPAEPEPDAIAFETALLAGDQRTALEIIYRCIDNGRHLVDIQLYVIRTAMYRIGEKWQANQISVAQEHMATAIVESVMTMALLRQSPPPPNGKRVLLACVAGNHHTIGLRMVADSFQLSGWDVRYLGANVPTAALLDQIAAWSPHLLGLGLSFGQHLQTVKDVIAQSSARFGANRPAVIIGGLAVNHFDRLDEIVGADGCSADARVAIDTASRLVTDETAPCPGLLMN